MEIPTTIGNLQFEHQQDGISHFEFRRRLTAAGSNLASQDENGFSHHVKGIRTTPSMITWETCTPCGSNSRARPCVSALNACLEMANGCIQAFAFTDAVAPVKIKVGTSSGPVLLLPLAERRSGSTAWAKRVFDRMGSHLFNVHAQTTAANPASTHRQSTTYPPSLPKNRTNSKDTSQHPALPPSSTC